MKRSFDLSLYFIADPSACAPRGLPHVVEDVVRGGASMVQLRHKLASDGVIEDQVRLLRDPLRRAGVRLIINDHVDLARRLEVDGVHLGQADESPRRAREQLGPEAIIGLSVTSAKEIATVDPEIVDYVGLGPVYETPSKSDAAPALGLEEFGAIRRQLPVPVVAIGGISIANASALRAAGADGVAVISAITHAPEPQLATRALAAIMREGRS